jgi:hypothetical protein
MKRPAITHKANINKPIIKPSFAIQGEQFLPC